MNNNNQLTLREARRQAGLKQREAALICGVSLRTWQNWETGAHKMPAAAKKIFQQEIEERKNDNK